MQSITTQVDTLFAECNKRGSPGCALAVIKEGAIVYKQGYGLANLEYDTPITPSTIFHVASVSKQFTAMAIVLLALEGKLALDDDVCRYLPELSDFGHTITIRHLAHHTSGLRDQWMLLVTAGWRMDDVITTADVMELVARQQRLNFQPGAEYLYSNTGYTLMAQIVERVSGQPFPHFCAERMFRPLGMENTHFHDDHRQVVKGRAYSYAPTGDGGFQHAVLSYATVGASSLFTTVEDLARWDDAFYTGAIGGQAALQQMQTKGILNDGAAIDYAFGLTIGEYRGLRTVGHSGGDAGFRSHLIRFPDHHFSVVILGNVSTLNPGELTKRVADLYLADHFTQPAPTLPSAIERVTLPAAVLADKVGVYYDAAKGLTVRLALRDGKLIEDLGPGFELAPLSATQFYFAAFPQVKYEFSTAADGTRQLAELVGADKPAIYRVVTPVTPTPDALAALAGAYYSEELDLFCHVRLRPNGLYMQRRRLGELPLRPTFADAFTWDISSGSPFPISFDLRFVRLADGRVTGFRLSSGRIRHLYFQRVAANTTTAPKGYPDNNGLVTDG